MKGLIAVPAAVLAFALSPSAGQDIAGERHKLDRYKEVQSTEMIEGLVGETTSIVYSDLRTGVRRRESAIRNVVFIQVQDPSKRRHLMINPEEKTAVLLPLDPKGTKAMLDSIATSSKEGRSPWPRKSSAAARR